MKINNINLAKESKLELEKLQDHVFKHIRDTLELNSIDELDKLGRKEIENRLIDLRRNNELNIRIDNLLRKIMYKYGVKSDFLQFPVNIRVIPGGANSKYKDLDYNVDTVHCDHWSGAPSDSYNCYLYLRKTRDSPSLIHFKVPDHKYMEVESYRGAYRNAPKFELEMIENDAYSGLLQIFNCKTPHMIDRLGRETTISLDFRLRDKSKEFDSDLANKATVEWTSSKMTSLGVYWRNHNLSVETIKEKIEQELENTKELGERYKALRVEYCRKFYNYKESP